MFGEFLWLPGGEYSRVGQAYRRKAPLEAVSFQCADHSLKSSDRDRNVKQMHWKVNSVSVDWKKLKTDRERVCVYV